MSTDSLLCVCVRERKKVRNHARSVATLFLTHLQKMMLTSSPLCYVFRSGGNLLLPHPTSFVLHYSCTKDPAPQNCTLNDCKPLRDAKGTWAHATELFPIYQNTMTMNTTNFTSVLQTESDSQGHLQDFGLGLSVFACSAAAQEAKTVKVALPANTIEDFPDPAEKLKSRLWTVYKEPPTDDDHVTNSLFRFPDMLNPL